jgi:invasion protein IalB
MRLVLPALAALLLLAPGPASAAQKSGAPTAGPPTAGQAFDDWAVECERAQDGTERCFLSQSQLLKESNARLLKASIGLLGPKGEPTLVLLLPLGVDLRAGIALKVDDRPQVSVAFQRCVQEGCVGVLPLDAATLAAMRGAKRIQVGMLPYAGQQAVTVDVSPRGLARGMDALR